MEKYHYLCSALDGEAAAIIKGFVMSVDTYPLAWAALVERFHKPRQLANILVENLLFTDIQTQGSISLSLKQLLTKFWTVEESEPCPDVILDARCENIVVTDMRRELDGRSSMPMPFHTSGTSMQDSSHSLKKF